MSTKNTLFNPRSFVLGISVGLVSLHVMNQFSANPVFRTYNRLALKMDAVSAVFVSNVSHHSEELAEDVLTQMMNKEEETEEELQCTEKENSRQRESVCQYFGGRHNLVHFFPMIRYHLPDANLFVDVGGNKGLVSARWLELWRPHLNITSKKYAMNVVKPYFVENKQPVGQRDICGVTDMCVETNNVEMNTIMAVSPITPTTFKVRRQQTDSQQEAKEDALNQRQQEFQIHSFEPSDPLFKMHQNFQNSSACSDELRKIWKWHKIAASDSVGRVYINPQFNEGASINKKATKGQEPNTDLATLDSLAYGTTKMFHSSSKNNNNMPRIIDVVKIDAESVDAKVVVGASRLLKERRIRVIMWETPNNFPISSFPDWFGAGPTIHSFCELIAALDTHAGMSCYFPLMQQKMAKLTGCCEPFTNKEERQICHRNCNHPSGCPVDLSNAACVSRTLAPALHRAMEAQSLLYHNY